MDVNVKQCFIVIIAQNTSQDSFLCIYVTLPCNKVKYVRSFCEASKNSIKNTQKPLLLKGFLVVMLLPRTRTVQDSGSLADTQCMLFARNETNGCLEEFVLYILWPVLQTDGMQTACSMIKALTPKLECCHGDNGPE